MLLTRSVLLLFLSTFGNCDVRFNNGGNCVGVRSCRPRCMTFHLHRESEVPCDIRQGIFTKGGNSNGTAIAWGETKVNCTSSSVLKGEAGADLPWNRYDDLTIKIIEQSSYWSFSTKIHLTPHDEDFTFCSIYPCPRDECALPEQMGSMLSFRILSNAMVGSATVELALSKTFEGDYVNEKATDNRIGPLSLVWMDDPTGCRPSAYSTFAPISPIENPTVDSVIIRHPESALFCPGVEYEPSELPKTAPVNLQLWFRDVDQVLSEEDTFIFASLTRSYLRVRGVPVEILSVIDQAIFPAFVPPENEYVTKLPDQSRKMEEDMDQHDRKTSTLMLRVHITGRNLRDAKFILNQQWSDYLAFLRRGQSALMFKKPGASSLPYTSAKHRWVIFFLTVNILLLALVLVIAIQLYRLRRQQIRMQQNVQGHGVLDNDDQPNDDGLDDDNTTANDGIWVNASTISSASLSQQRASLPRTAIYV